MIAEGIVRARNVDIAMIIITEWAYEYDVDLDVDAYAQIRQDNAEELVTKTLMAIHFLQTLESCNNNQVSQQATNELERLQAAIIASIEQDGGNVGNNGDQV